MTFFTLVLHVSNLNIQRIRLLSDFDFILEFTDLLNFRSFYILKNFLSLTFNFKLLLEIRNQKNSRFYKTYVDLFKKKNSLLEGTYAIFWFKIRNIKVE
jgi:hypothetical protein